MEMTRGKPSQFSDPYHDWEGYEDTFRVILDKDDQELTTDDFGIIFAKHLPAADYAEGIYYIARCIAHIAEGRDIHQKQRIAAEETARAAQYKYNRLVML